ncbi:MAG: NAD+ synthase [Thaumarchaeota archaeon]|nr:NAD+ synthase [Nitrososphaerota archaeon]
MAGYSRSIEPTKEERRITTFIRKVVRDAGARGVVVGVSGGVDSALAGSLCVKALGPQNVVAALMPSNHTPKNDLRDGEALASRWGVETVRVSISPLVDALDATVGEKGGRIAKANVEARTRMIILYLIANSRGLLVAGTGDRSEELLGFFTKWGDGGVDFLPIAHLYKTQVRLLSSSLGLPKRIVDKPASPQLWPGHTAEEELPAAYEKLDVVLHCLFDLKVSPKAAASKAKVSPAVVREVIGMHRRSAHKRALPPSLARI